MHASIRTRLLASLLVVTLASAVVLSWYFLQEVESYGVRKLMERVEGDASLLAALVTETGIDDHGALEDALTEALLVPASRMMVLDDEGQVVADSGPGAPDVDDEPLPIVGGDDADAFGERPEVANALEGTAASYQRTAPDGKLQIYSAYPIFDGDTVAGVAYASARTFSVQTLIRDYQTRLLLLGAVFVVVTLVLAEVLSRWLTAPLLSLETTSAAFAAGDHTVRVQPSGARETRALGEAFNTLADEVERMVDQLRAEEKRKSRFVSDVSHELRTPLTAIRGTAETLLEGDVPPEEAGRFLNTIVREADRLARLADDLLTLQRIEGATGELPLRRVRPREVADRAIEALEHVTEQRGVSVKVTGEAPEVLGDPDRLQQVVANLVDNASRVMTTGGSIVVEVGSTTTSATIAILDEGPGMPAEDLDRVFDRFYRSQPSRDRTSGGAGLGLAIVKAIIDRHGGEITAANRDGGGMSFTVSLPSFTSRQPKSEPESNRT
ncbi:MAG: ATP-binding protein [Coriobacteriia bacterium]|nr:ATP-binding protein [Coriobacteriia bacterium]